MTKSSPWAVASSPHVYDSIGLQYRKYRKPDTRIAAQIASALGNARTVCNVGAGSGSYEPSDRFVVAVEPSLVMVRQRSSKAVRAVAEALPFADEAFDAVTAFLTVHHWQNPRAAFAELRRVARRRVVLALDFEINSTFWMVREYLPEIASLETRAPSIDAIAEGLCASRIETVWIPHDCTDGFLAAYWRRPDAYLNPDVRACISGIAQLDPSIVDRGIERLRMDLERGAWRAKHEDLLGRAQMDYGYRLVIADG
jgi:SAM-dependent methyltransferase